MNRSASTILLAILLGIGFCGLAQAEETPAVADLLQGKPCAAVTPADSSLEVLGALTRPMTPQPEPKSCFYAIYDEFYYQGELCRWGDTCSRQYFGSCPNGWDYHYTEIIPCCH
jgi:hypothetical protein